MEFFPPVLALKTLREMCFLFVIAFFVAAQQVLWVDKITEKPNRVGISNTYHTVEYKS